MAEKEYLTVKDFAKRAGVSTQRVYQLLAKDLQDSCKVIGNTKYVHISALERFSSESLSNDLQEDLPDALQVLCKSLQEQNAAFSEQLVAKDKQIEALNQQLTAKDEQLAALASAIAAAQEAQTRLTESLAAEQALHAGTIQKQLAMQDEKPVGFFGKLFRKKKKENGDEIQG